MKEKLDQLKEQVKLLWAKSTKKQKTIFFAVFSVLLVFIAIITIFSTTTRYVPLYTGLSIQEVGQITEELDARSVPYELEGGGTTVKVPEQTSEIILVELAGQGIPHSGNIDYSFFSENTSWGITDNEFNILKLDAMQTELANLIKSIDGIDDANVMINLPEESVFVSDTSEEASASIVLHTKFGHEFEGNQVESLYHLVAKAVPNLPEDNIVIMNQFFEYYDQKVASGGQDEYMNQQGIKQEIERDLQKRLQQMLGVMVGMDGVVVSVTADVDFTTENRIEDLVEPVDVDSMEGIPVSIESIHETFEGNQAEGGVVGVGEEDIANYPAAAQNEDGNYELVKDTVNYELNRIHRELAEAPYKIRDLGIQVVVDNVVGMEEDTDEVLLLTAQEQNTVESGIESILNSMITTSIDKGYGEINPEDKVSIVFQEFSSRTAMPTETTPMIPMWIYIVGTILLIIIIALVVLLMRRKEVEEEPVAPISEMGEEIEVADITNQPKTEADIQKEQLEKMAKDNPEDFAKLVRSWIADD